MRVLFASLSAALWLITSCGGSSPAPARPVDTVCVEGMPFAQSVTAIDGRYEPGFAALSDRLAAAHSVADSQAVFDLVAGLLAQEEADLAAVRAPTDDATVVQGQIAADEAMRTVAVKMSTAPPSALPTVRPEFVAAAQARDQAARDLRLRAQFLEGECAS